MAKIVAWAAHATKDSLSPVIDYFHAFVDDDKGAEAKFAEVLKLENLHSASICEVLRSTDYDSSLMLGAEAKLAFQQMVAKVKSVNALQHAGMKISADDWSELYQMVNAAEAILSTNTVDETEAAMRP